MASTATDIRRWARLGAEQRLHQLYQEVAAIHAAFPDLRRGRTFPSAAPRAKATTTPTRRRRHKLSADARKRISDAQKARWAKQKAGRK